VPIGHASTLAFGRRQRTSEKPSLSRLNKVGRLRKWLDIAVPSRIRVQVYSPTMCPSMTAVKPSALSCLGRRLQSPELKTRKLDGLFDFCSGKSVWRMLIGLDGTRRSPRSMGLRQFASRWITGKCAQVGTCLRSEYIDEHNDAFRNARL